MDGIGGRGVECVCCGRDQIGEETEKLGERAGALVVMVIALQLWQNDLGCQNGDARLTLSTSKETETECPREMFTNAVLFSSLFFPGQLCHRRTPFVATNPFLHVYLHNRSTALMPLLNWNRRGDRRRLGRVVEEFTAVVKNSAMEEALLPLLLYPQTF